MERPYPAYKGDQAYMFVCYSHADADLVYPELVWLKERGCNIWYDEGIAPGKEWTEELGQAIEEADRFLFFVTPNSVESQYCRDELSFALNHKKQIFSVYLEQTDLSKGLELSIGSKQAILKYELPEQEYRDKLISSVIAQVGHTEDVSTAPTTVETSNNRSNLVGFGLVVLAILVVGAIFIFRSPTPPSVPASQVSQTGPVAGASSTSLVKDADVTIAVLAFENMSDDPQMAYLGDGIAEELMNALYHGGLQVASRTDAFSFKGVRTRTRDIGRELGVEVVLEGSVRRSGDQLRITAQLINVEDGFHLWSAVYKRSVGDLFDVQDTIVREVSNELFGALNIAPSTVDLAGTRNIRAYDVFMLGRFEQRADTPEAINRAIGHYEEVIRLDSDFHQAYAALVRAYSRHAIFTGERVEAQAKISEIRFEFEQRAASWRHDPEWWRSLWEISFVTWDPDGMERALASGIRSKRSNPAVPSPVAIAPYAEYARLLNQSRLHEDALRYAEVVGGWGVVAQAQYILGEPNLAIDSMVRVQGVSQLVYLFLRGRMLAHEGRVDEARSLVNGLTSPYRDYLRWEIAFNTGDHDGAHAILESLETADVSPTFLGVYRLQMGDLVRGFRHLKNAVEQHDEILLYLGNSLEVYLPHHVLDDTRYLAILDATGFTAAWERELCKRASTLTTITGIEMSCLSKL